jgi:hypothetical protein
MKEEKNHIQPPTDILPLKVDINFPWLIGVFLVVEVVTKNVHKN